MRARTNSAMGGGGDAGAGSQRRADRFQPGRLQLPDPGAAGLDPFEPGRDTADIERNVERQYDLRLAKTFA